MLQRSIQGGAPSAVVAGRIGGRWCSGQANRLLGSRFGHVEHPPIGAIRLTGINSHARAFMTIARIVAAA